MGQKSKKEITMAGSGGVEKSVGLWIFLEAESTGFADGLNVNVRVRKKG